MNRKNTYRTLAAATLLVVTTSCAMMQDNRDNCPTCKNPLHVTLKYDYNLLRADMFNDHVGAATCYVVNPQTNIVVAKQQAANTATSQPLKERTFGFNFEGLQPGAYDVYAVAAQRQFGQLTNFVPNELGEGDDIRQLRLAVNTNGGTSAEPLDTLWHGMLPTPVTLPEQQPAQATVSLVRDTKNLNIMLVQNQNPTDNGHTKYDVSITDNNALLDYDNSQMAAETITYRPYAAWTTETIDDGEGTRAAGDVIRRTAHYDLSMGRLFQHQDDATKNARLIINNSQTGQNIVNIDLPYYLSLVRNAAETEYPIQEFLDRGYDYRLDFILDGNEWRYMTITILVTGWSLRIQHADL